MPDPQFRATFGGRITADLLDLQSSAAFLPNGYSVVVDSRSSNLASPSRVYPVLYDKNFAEVSSPPLGPGSPFAGFESFYYRNYQFEPTVTALTNGRYVVAFTAQIPTLSQFDILFQIYGADGKTIGNYGRANSTLDNVAGAPQVGALTNGGFVLVWNQAEANATQHVSFRLFDATGAAVGGDQQVAASAAAQSVSEVITLRNGNFVVALTDNSAETIGGTSSIGARAIIHNASGQLISNVAINDAAPGAQSGADLVALADGGFAATWLDAGVSENGAATTTGGVWFQRFAADGARSAAAVRLFTGTNLAAPHIEVLSDGSFALTFNTQLFALDFSGQIMGAPVDVGIRGNPVYAISALDLTVSADDRVLAFYSTTSVPARYTGEGFQGLQPYRYATDGADSYTIGTLAAYYDGGAGNDSIVGSARNDTIDGGVGVDTISGGAGDDIYYVDSVGDVILDGSNAGKDTVFVSAANYLLNPGAEVEELRPIAGAGAINIAGNEFAQTIYGNEFANIINGNGGDDTLNGGGGDDIYRVFTTGTVLLDSAGFDTVYVSGTSYFLYGFAGVEYLSAAQQIATDPIYIVGNAVSQVIVGNYGNNTLNGRSGGNGNPDTLIGLFGDDTYAAFTQGDVVREIDGQGNDIVYANISYQLRDGTSVEALSAIDQSAAAAADAFSLIGNGVAQTVVGNNAANVLDGRGGNDTLVGLGGADTFALTTALGMNNVDTIRDYVSGTDKIGLASDIFAGVTGGGILASEFVLGTTATTADTKLIYDQASGELRYDVDGNGSGESVLLAHLGGGTSLVFSDFTVLAPVANIPA